MSDFDPKELRRLSEAATLRRVAPRFGRPAGSASAKLAAASGLARNDHVWMSTHCSERCAGNRRSQHESAATTPPLPRRDGAAVKFALLSKAEEAALMAAWRAYGAWEGGGYLVTSRRHRLSVARSLVEKGLLTEEWVTLCDSEGELLHRDERESRCFQVTPVGTELAEGIDARGWAMVATKAVTP